MSAIPTNGTSLMSRFSILLFIPVLLWLCLSGLFGVLGITSLWIWGSVAFVFMMATVVSVLRQVSYLDVMIKDVNGQLLSSVKARFPNDVSDSVFEVSNRDSIAGLIDITATLVKQLSNNMTAIVKRQDAETERLLNSFSMTKTNVMIADENLEIVYANDAMVDMMTMNSDVLKKAFHDFDAQALIGMNIEIFCKHPDHQKNIIHELSSTHQNSIHIGNLTFNVITSPVYDGNKNRIGTVVEWEDQTQQFSYQRTQEHLSIENLRLRKSLDVSFSPVMLAGVDLNISYMNKALDTMLRCHQKALFEVLPGFSVEGLMGTSIDELLRYTDDKAINLSELNAARNLAVKLNGISFNLMITPLFTDDGSRLGMLLEWRDNTDSLIEENKRAIAAEENLRIRQALDSVTSNVMISDSELNIIYMNDSVKNMMSAAESDIRTQIPEFRSAGLVGKSIDVFHKNPAHQRQMIKALTTTHRAQIVVGGRTFSLVANPIIDKGTRIGTVVEWGDRTAEVAIEKEIDSVVDAAALGDFTRQLSLEDKEGFLKKLSIGLNSLVSTTEVVLNDMLRVLGAMSKGDLSERITRDYKGSFAQLRQDANSTTDKLTDVINRVSASASTIISASDEISQGNTDLSQRTEEQASSLEQTASSMEQMTATVKQSADNAVQASLLANQAQEKAREGGKVVERAVEAMGDIDQSSKKISDIIGVIDEIAFQTNLLALNAAVEAARAGEQGRGFAVVAGEVRNLAQRSAGAAKEIKGLIRDSVIKVSDGTALVNASGETLFDIVGAVEEVYSMMQAISDAAQEQTSGIDQVNIAVAQMDQMTQQNAALVQQASAAGQAMAEQAKSLGQTLQFFSAAKIVSYEQDTTPKLKDSDVNESVVLPNMPSMHAPVIPVFEEPDTKGIQRFQASNHSSDDEWEDF